MLRQQVLPAPAIAGLEDPNLVAKFEQLRGDPAQEVRISVVPIRNQGMSENHEAHAILPSEVSEP